MSEQIYTFRDPSFNLNQAYYYTLLIQVDEKSFSYAITYKKDLIAWDTNCNLAELAEPQELAEELTATYKKVVIGLPSNGFTLVPAALFNKDQVANYARLLDVKADERVLAQPIDSQNFIIYKINEKVAAAVQRFDFDNAVYQNKGWIIAASQDNPTSQTVHVHAENSKAEFLYLKNGAIRFYNNFNYETEDDLAYYVSFVLDELGLQSADINLKLSGNLKAGDKYTTRLEQFYPNISYFNPQLLNLPTQIDAQQVLTLTALSLCGSSEAV
ncbi:DUF3822 family protein [Mucilaginibacter sp. dw_454]|uniref:DUF3822 family protein n=1 Tax=Mucilaginibacter sp. dw_454 TaxID=2720079 RepID=UPI001BD3ED93|nr:DUF3822 family protein [Mucilaginibacter sp. dw_454]